MRLENAIALSVPPALRDFVMDRSLTAGHNWAQTRRSRSAGRQRLCPPQPSGGERDGMLDSEEARRYQDLPRECLLSLRSAESGNPS